MPTRLTTKAREEGTYMITYAPTDNNGDAISPETLQWTLLDVNNAVINSRDSISVSSPDTSNTIVLTGDDLAIDSDGISVVRKILFKATYNATIDGTNYLGLVIYIEAEFKIVPLGGV